MPLFKGCGCKAKPAKAIDYITDKKKTVYGKTEKIVKDKLRELQIQALAGNLHKKENLKSITIYDIADKMIEEQLALNEVRHSTYERKKSTLKMLSAISEKDVRDVSEEDVIGNTAQKDVSEIGGL